MSDSPLPRYPGSLDPEPSQRERHERARGDVPWVHVATFFAVAVAVGYQLLRLTIRVTPMPVLI